MAMTEADGRIISRAKAAHRRRRLRARNDIHKELPIPKPKPAKKVRPKQELPKKKVAVKKKGSKPAVPPTRPNARALERASGNASFKRLDDKKAMRAKKMADKLRPSVRGSGEMREIPLRPGPGKKVPPRIFPPFAPPERKKPPIGSGGTVPPFAPPGPVRPPSSTRPVSNTGAVPVIGTPTGGSKILRPPMPNDAGPRVKVRNMAGAPKPRVKMGSRISRIGSGGRSS